MAKSALCTLVGILAFLGSFTHRELRGEGVGEPHLQGVQRDLRRRGAKGRNTVTRMRPELELQTVQHLHAWRR